MRLLRTGICGGLFGLLVVGCLTSLGVENIITAWQFWVLIFGANILILVGFID